MNNLSLTNWTPHDINIYDKDGKNLILTIKKSDVIARLCSKNQTLTTCTIDNIDIPIISKNNFSGLIGTNIIENCCDVNNVIVSMPVAEYLFQEHWDENCFMQCSNVFIPDSGPDSAVRDKFGQIIGVKRLMRFI